MITHLESTSRYAIATKSEVRRATRISREIAVKLSSSPYRELRAIQFTYSDGLVVLEGIVSTFHFKQIAQSIVQQIDGVERITNALSVPTKDYHVVPGKSRNCR